MRFAALGCQTPCLEGALRRFGAMQPHTDARIALLSRLLDHAPLFPPASLALQDAVAEDERARASRAAFMLGRFACPASRLDENAFSWRDRSAPADELTLARRNRFHSIGSCSFFEPVEELEALGVLPL
jgi:hypothetical protein